MTPHNDLDRELSRLLAEEHARRDTDSSGMLCNCPCCQERARLYGCLLGNMIALFEGRLS
jgi:hypothetical protein